MSLQLAAKHLASHGRGDDSMLVHMTPAEVGGLQAIAKAHGGSLTINPKTGLPEAGFLSAILPMVAGFALGPAGLALMSAPAAAATIGGVATLATGSLAKGLQAGLGAYSGAGLGEGLLSAGANAGTNAAIEPGIGWGAEARNRLGDIAQASNVGAGAGAGAGANVPSWGAEARNRLGDITQTAPMQPLAPVPTPTPTIDLRPTTPMPTQEALSSGLKYAAESPLEFLKRNKGAATAGLMSIAGAMTPEAPKVPTPAPTTIRPYTYTPGYTGSERQPGVSDSSERKWFEHKFTPGTPYTPSMAGGGVVAFEDGGKVELENGGFVVPADVVSALGNGSSSAGLELLAKKLGAKPIDGPGDGMSDSIPTSIEGKRKAAVARDEAYIPADAVARAGGAAKLYEMMDRIRKHAHGKTTQQRQVNPDNLV